MAEEKVTALFTVKGVDRVTRAFGKITSSAAEAGRIVRNTALQLAAIGTAATFAVTKLARLGGEIDGTRTSFIGLAGGAANANAILESLDRALDGTVSRFELMRAANQAILLGLPASAEEMGRLANVAQRLGVAVGRTGTEAFQDIVTGIGRQSRLILDNLGLVIDTTRAYERFAQSAGKTVEQLTEAEKKTAFYNETLIVAEEKIAGLGTETLNTNQRFQQLIASFVNLRNRLAEMIATSPVLSQAIEQIRQRFEDWMNFVINNEGQVREFIDNLLRQLQSIATTVLQFIPTFIGFFRFLVQNARTIITIFTAIRGAQAGAALGSIGGPIGRLIGGGLGLIGGGIAVNQLFAGQQPWG